MVEIRVNVSVFGFFVFWLAGFFDVGWWVLIGLVLIGLVVDWVGG